MTNYTAEEIDKAFNDLSNEKERVKDLEQRLQQMQTHQEKLENEFQEFQLTNHSKQAVSLEVLDQFKQLLKAFKRRQLEEIEASETRERLILDLKAARIHIDELKSGTANSLKPSSNRGPDFYDSLEAENKVLQEKNAVSTNRLEKLRDELQRTQEENCGYQEQICTTKNLLTNYQDQLNSTREGYQNHHGQSQEEVGDQHSIEASRQHAEQLERSIQFLREKAEESHLESQQLQRELQSAQDTLNSYVEILAAAKLTEDNLQSQLFNEKSEKADALQQVQSANSQFDILKAHLHNLQQELDHRQNNSHEEKNSHEQLINENLQLASALEKKNHAFKALESEVAAIKQNLVRGLREAKELENHYLEAVKEKVDAVSQFSQLQRAADKQRLEIEKIKSHSKELLASSLNQQQEFDRQHAQLKNDLRELQTSLASNEIENEALKKQILELEVKLTNTLTAIEDARLARQHMQAELYKHEKYAQEKEFMVKELLDKLMRLEEEKNQAYDELGSCHLALEDKEQQFDEAQQHLAKKVREVALLDAKVEELKEQAKASSIRRESVENHNGELQVRLQKCLDEQVILEEKTHSLMGEIDQWQAKHSQLEVKWQTAKEQIEELQRIGERHQQLQHMVTNFGSILGMPMEPTKSAPVPPANSQIEISSLGHFTEKSHPKPTQHKSELEHSTTISEKAPSLFQNLFDGNKNNNSPKQDLFD